MTSTASKDAASDKLQHSLAMKPDRPISQTHLKTNPATPSPSRPPAAPRAGTTPNMTTNMHTTGKQKPPAKDGPDSFENAESEDPPEPPRASVDLDELPIELIGLTDSFIESLQAKVHPNPPNIDVLSGKFQDFYATASGHIGTHLAALASRQNRLPTAPPGPSTPASRPSTASILRAKAASISGRGDKVSRTPPPPPPQKTEAEQQMITADELADRKRQRRLLEQKRSLIEEAVERRLCEGIYDRIYRHRTTQDEAQDEKLRSKTAALDVVGIGPADLGVDLGEPPDASRTVLAARQREVRQWLEPARKELGRMSQTHYPLGKLNRLKAAHKAIVDTLAHFHPSSSADEIMPMLIYTLITLSPEQLHVVSDLGFIQRFRWEAKIEGEAAYCMTNLEASISFLETVDLSTLRADEAPSGPMKASSSPDTPTKTETFPPAYDASPAALALPVAATPSMPEVTGTEATAKADPSAASSGLRAAVQLRNRRLSDLVNTPAQALSSASDAVLNTFSAADQGLKTIGNSLEGSYRLFFGKLQKQQSGEGAGGSDRAGGMGSHGSTGNRDGMGDAAAEVLVPKTLDEARKLISTPPPGSEDEASLNGEEASTTPAQPLHAPLVQHQQQQQPQQHQQQQHRRPLERRTTSGSLAGTTASVEERLLSIVGGRKVSSTSSSRDHSADSARSGGSSARRVVAFAEQPDDAGSASASMNSNLANSNSNSNHANSANSVVMDSVRNLGSSLNPMSRLPGIGSFRGFGRTASSPSVPAAADKSVDGGDLATAFPDLAPSLPAKVQIAPPVKRFLEVHHAADLRISEVGVLLRDYQRLANALKELGGFREP